MKELREAIEHLLARQEWRKGDLLWRVQATVTGDHAYMYVVAHTARLLESRASAFISECRYGCERTVGMNGSPSVRLSPHAQELYAVIYLLAEVAEVSWDTTTQMIDLLILEALVNRPARERAEEVLS